MSRNLTAAAAIFSVCFAVFRLSPVAPVLDSAYTLLAARNLLERGCYNLDPYFKGPIDDTAAGELRTFPRDRYGYHVYEHQRHLYYFYPPGTVLLSVPLVTVAGLLGISPIAEDGLYDMEAEASLQRTFAALIAAAGVVALYLLTRVRLGERISALAALALAFGTPVWSTASRVLWTHTWGFLILSFTLLHLFSRSASGKPVNGVLTGTLLSWLYFVRPTFSISILGLALLVLLHHRSAFPSMAAAGLAWLGLFIAFARATSDGWLPPYYLIAKALSWSTVPEALAALLVSPSRGLLVFSPMVAIPFCIAWRHRHTLRDLSWAFVAVAAMGLHLLSVAAFGLWWGGFSYGPRYTVDFMPWLALFAVVALDARQRASPAPRPGLATAASIALIGVSVLVHSAGSFSMATQAWNVYPTNIDQDPARVWDWKDPQFLAGLGERRKTPSR